MDSRPFVAIPLQTDGECPHCRRPVLGLADGRCSACEGWLEGHWERWPAVESALCEVAGGWDWARLEAWVRPRPAQLAWALQTRTWKALEHWVHEDLWRAWAHLDARRRDRRLALQVEDVAVDGIRLAGIGTDRRWVRVRLRGRRSAFVYRTFDGAAGEGSPELLPFEEIWTLVPTGESAESAELGCPACGAACTFEDMNCPYCGVPIQRPLGPWRLEDLRPIPMPGQTAWNPFAGGRCAP